MMLINHSSENEAIEGWLHSEVAAAYDELKADRSGVQIASLLTNHCRQADQTCRTT
jgi:hypothetical protein